VRSGLSPGHRCPEKLGPRGVGKSAGILGPALLFDKTPSLGTAAVHPGVQSWGSTSPGKRRLQDTRPDQKAR